MDCFPVEIEILGRGNRKTAITCIIDGGAGRTGDFNPVIGPGGLGGWRRPVKQTVTTAAYWCEVADILIKDIIF
jgi:hypothetical protein